MNDITREEWRYAIPRGIAAAVLGFVVLVAVALAGGS